MKSDNELTNLHMFIICSQQEVFNEFNLTNIERSIMFILISHYNHITGVTFPSQKRLCNQLRLTKPTVIKALNGLIDKRVLERQKDKNNYIYHFTHMFIYRLEQIRKGYIFTIHDTDILDSEEIKTDSLDVNKYKSDIVDNITPEDIDWD